MKTLNNYINEALIKKDTKIKTYNYYPKDKAELRTLLYKLLKERGIDANLNDIDTSKIKDMSWLFDGLDPHNIDISKWNVSNVKDMLGMFYNCENFNCDLSRWNVNKVKNMRFMFQFCKHFNSDLSKWDVRNVADMRFIFYECTALKNKPNWYKE